MSYAKLRGRIREIYGTQKAFASAIGLSATELSMRLGDKTSWSADEMRKAIICLQIPADELPSYFFRPEVHNY